MVKEAGVQGGNSLKIREKSLKIQSNMAPTIAWLQKWGPTFAEKHEKTIFRSHTKNDLPDFVGEKICR